MGEKKVAIVQSNYIPWKGYFDLINLADEFVLLDDVQYTRRDWRNRNKIMTGSGPQWLTIPVKVKGGYHQRICDTVISDSDWWKSHWRTICHNYARAPYFKECREWIEPLYTDSPLHLSEINSRFIEALNAYLQIETRISTSAEYELSGDKTERLLSICLQAEATVYISGPAARIYLDESLFEASGISVMWMDYNGYPEYRQLGPAFDHHVSILDLVLNEGPSAREYMKSFSRAG